MPTREAPADVKDSTKSPETVTGENTAADEPLEQDGSATGQQTRTAVNASSGNSRWVDYDTHELLMMISELEDERRWARLREGIWIALLVHFLLLSAITWIPKYLLKVPQVVDPFEAIKQRKDLTYLDLPPDALEKIRPKVQPKPLSKPPQVDKKTLEDLQKSAPPPPPAETKTPEPAPAQQAAPPPIPPQQQSQSQLEAPKPPAVPARPNFAMGSQNPADQLRDAMKNAARSHGQGDAGNLGPNEMTMHPGAGTGGIQVLSDTQGVDFSGWLQRWHYETERTWDPLIPDEVNPPIYKSGMVAIRFKVLPNGRLMEGSLVLEGRSGDVALDRAAWGALTGSNYPPLPRDFHGPYLELRAYFLYNMQPR
jgi:outer membrane biosynthesis protein TonB